MADKVKINPKLIQKMLANVKTPNSLRAKAMNAIDKSYGTSDRLYVNKKLVQKFVGQPTMPNALRAKAMKVLTPEKTNPSSNQKTRRVFRDEYDKRIMDERRSLAPAIGLGNQEKIAAKVAQRQANQEKFFSKLNALSPEAREKTMSSLTALDAAFKKKVAKREAQGKYGTYAEVRSRRKEFEKTNTARATEEKYDPVANRQRAVGAVSPKSNKLEKNSQFRKDRVEEARKRLGKGVGFPMDRKRAKKYSESEASPARQKKAADAYRAAGGSTDNPVNNRLRKMYGAK